MASFQVHSSPFVCLKPRRHFPSGNQKQTRVRAEGGNERLTPDSPRTEDFAVTTAKSEMDGNEQSCLKRDVSKIEAAQGAQDNAQPMNSVLRISLLRDKGEKRHSREQLMMTQMHTDSSGLSEQHHGTTPLCCSEGTVTLD